MKRLIITALFALLLGSAGHAIAAPPTDYWQDRAGLGDKYFLNMAHAGGAEEGPANTLFAFKKAIENGADSLEMDGYVTKDGVFVVTHDLSPNSTSDIAETPYAGKTIGDMTLAELKTLDFGYKFSPGKGHYDYNPSDPHPYRGMALEDGPEPPAGYTRNDFRIATFKEVLDAFPHTPINIDMKAPYDNTQMATDAADVLADLMADYPERSDDVIVASFFQGAMERFHELLPSHHALTASEDALLGYVAGGPIAPVPVALQPPDKYNLGGNIVDTVPILRPKADADGYAIHVWPQNGSVDGPELWQKMIDQGADGFFTDRPSELGQYLCDHGFPRPDGTPRCAAQVCPDGQTGFAPDHCVDIPVDKCPLGQVGTPPNCQPHGDPKAVLTKVILRPKTRKIVAGRKIRLRVVVRGKPGFGNRFRVKLRSSNRQVRLPRSVIVALKGRSGSRIVTVRATRRARGKVVITARNGRLAARSRLKVKRVRHR